MPRPRIRYQLAVSLDGFIGPHDGSVDWLAPYESMAEELLGPFVQEIGGLIMGRLTYEQYRSLGPSPFDDMPTMVLTGNPAFDAGPSAEVCRNGPQAAINALDMKMSRGDIWLFGGGKTASCFLDEGLIDLVEMTVVPVVLGEGKPLFPGAKTPITLELVSVFAGDMGTVSTVYTKRSESPNSGH